MKHHGSGMTISPELLMRQVLLHGMVLLAGDEYRVEELFERFDELRHGTQDFWVDDLKEALTRMVNVAASDGVKIGVGYPSLETRFPYLSIVPEEGHEDASQATCADFLSDDKTVIGTITPGSDPTVAENVSARLVKHTTIGAEWETTVQVGSWTEVPEESMLLHAMAKHIVFGEKGRLLESGILNVSLSETGFQPDDRMVQRSGWVPVLRCRLEWTWRQTRRKNAPYYWIYSSPSHSN